MIKYLEDSICRMQGSFRGFSMNQNSRRDSFFAKYRPNFPCFLYRCGTLPSLFLEWRIAGVFLIWEMEFSDCFSALECLAFDKHTLGSLCVQSGTVIFRLSLAQRLFLRILISSFTRPRTARCCKIPAFFLSRNEDF